MEGSMKRGMTETAGANGGTTANMNEEFEQLKSSFNQLRGDVVNLFSHAFGVGRSGGEAARDYGMDAMEQLKNRVYDLRDRGAVQMHHVEKKVEENPISSLMIAFGVGFILAKFFRH
jgi:ElaB/YqjD/DUF883 family membrane-anchored ribosome-binding protein